MRSLLLIMIISWGCYGGVCSAPSDPPQDAISETLWLGILWPTEGYPEAARASVRLAVERFEPDLIVLPRQIAWVEEWCAASAIPTARADQPGATAVPSAKFRVAIASTPAPLTAPANLPERPAKLPLSTDPSPLRDAREAGELQLAELIQSNDHDFVLVANRAHPEWLAKTMKTWSWHKNYGHLEPRARDFHRVALDLLPASAHVMGEPQPLIHVVRIMADRSIRLESLPADGRAAALLSISPRAAPHSDMDVAIQPLLSHFEGPPQFVSGLISAVLADGDPDADLGWSTRDLEWAKSPTLRLLDPAKGNEPDAELQKAPDPLPTDAVVSPSRQFAILPNFAVDAERLFTIDGDDGHAVDLVDQRDHSLHRLSYSGTLGPFPFEVVWFSDRYALIVGKVSGAGYGDPESPRLLQTISYYHFCLYDFLLGKAWSASGPPAGNENLRGRSQPIFRGEAPMWKRVRDSIERELEGARPPVDAPLAERVQAAFGEQVDLPPAAAWQALGVWPRDLLPVKGEPGSRYLDDRRVILRPLDNPSPSPWWIASSWESRDAAGQLWFGIGDGAYQDRHGFTLLTMVGRGSLPMPSRSLTSDDRKLHLLSGTCASPTYDGQPVRDWMILVDEGTGFAWRYTGAR